MCGVYSFDFNRTKGAKPITNCGNSNTSTIRALLFEG